MSTQTQASAVSTLASVSRLHIVAIASLGTLTFGWLFSGRYYWALALVCGLDWCLVNLLNRVVDLVEDRANGITGTDFVAGHRKALMLGGFGLLGASFVVLQILRPELTPLRLCYHALGLSYNWPILPGRRRIKQLYFWKNTASAVGFMLTVFGYPLAVMGWSRAGEQFAKGVSWTTIALAAAFFFALELSYEVIYDLRDAQGDAKAGVRTYPVVHGMGAALRIIDGLLAASGLFLALGYGAGVIPWRLFVMILAPALQAFLYKRAFRRGLGSGDCIRLTWLGAGLLFAYHLWIWAGLPGVGT